MHTTYICKIQYTLYTCTARMYYTYVLHICTVHTYVHTYVCTYVLHYVRMYCTYVLYLPTPVLLPTHACTVQSVCAYAAFTHVHSSRVMYCSIRKKADLTPPTLTAVPFCSGSDKCCLMSSCWVKQTTTQLC